MNTILDSTCKKIPLPLETCFQFSLNLAKLVCHLKLGMKTRLS